MQYDCKKDKILLGYLKRTLFRGNDCDIKVGHHLDRCKEWMLFQVIAGNLKRQGGDDEYLTKHEMVSWTW